MAACYLTTIDNSYDPSVDFDAWYNEDHRLGYDTCGTLARITTMFYGYSDDLSEERQSAIIESAIDDIIAYDVLGIYKKIKKEKT